MARARDLRGHMLGDIARSLGVHTPNDLRRDKGWVGMLLERALGATGANRAEPDFPHLGVELKTIPVHPDGRPRESTWVCTAALDGQLAPRWSESWACRKLSRVLWMPIVSKGRLPPAERWVGKPLLWSPSPAQTELLAADYESIVEAIAVGDIDRVDARRGKALQLRPKAAHGRDWVWVLDAEAQWGRTSPRGFYLRATFTRDLLSTGD